jgi:hypothetical protein
MKRGQTIVAERERQESASERMLARKKMRNKRVLSVVAVVLILIILTILGIMGWQVLFKDQVIKPDTESTIPEPTVEINDEAGVGVSNRIKEYIAWLEQDFKELGYTMTRVDLPRDKSRELLVSLDGYKGYIKMNIDRGTGVSVEDADRMIKYLNGGEFEYIDVRVEGKGYYK